MSSTKSVVRKIALLERRLIQLKIKDKKIARQIIDNLQAQSVLFLSMMNPALVIT